MNRLDQMELDQMVSWSFASALACEAWQPYRPNSGELGAKASHLVPFFAVELNHEYYGIYLESLTDHFEGPPLLHRSNLSILTIWYGKHRVISRQH